MAHHTARHLQAMTLVFTARRNALFALRFRPLESIGDDAIGGARLPTRVTKEGKA